MQKVWGKLKDTGRDLSVICSEEPSIEVDGSDSSNEDINTYVEEYSYDDKGSAVDEDGDDDDSSNSELTSSSSINVVTESDSPDNYLGGYNDWGSNRASKENERKCRGFPWTTKELNIVREWKSSNPTGSIKCCLEDIYANKHFRIEFHIHHVINTARLLTAWKKF